jgi:hypothetical protein
VIVGGDMRAQLLARRRLRRDRRAAPRAALGNGSRREDCTLMTVAGDDLRAAVATRGGRIARDGRAAGASDVSANAAGDRMRPPDAWPREAATSAPREQ